MKPALALIAFTLFAFAQSADKPSYQAELIFPLEHWHNHSSSIIETPDGGLLVCWFHGSGERTADDVKIEGARWNKAKHAWSDRFTMADTPGFPDTNPTMFLDRQSRLWLFWPVILAHEWHTALMKYKVSTDYQKSQGPPVWGAGDNLLLIPRNMAARTEEVLKADLKRPGPLKQYASRMIALAHDEYFSRVGWFTRTHPQQLLSGRILVPMYSDGYSFSIMGISDDDGATWYAGEPIVGYGNIQPTVLRKRNGDLVAYMRDNGPPPKRAHMSLSKDEGITWTAAEDSDIPNPGTSLEGLVLRDGLWALVYNDIEQSRYSLAIALSDDEGKTWKWKRHLDRDERGRGAGSFHYPSIIQSRDGSIHVTYSYFLNHLPEGADRKSIKHARFNTAWVKQGDPAQ
ncbi:MAG TPA: exo-alpha-sialidase [Bryobacteraceae bacterium]|nr:exo-alpha-sialidase [Bryobacteraceae bacterium]